MAATSEPNGSARVEVTETSSRGDGADLAVDGELAVVVAPRRDVHRVLPLAGQLDVRSALALETHVHNDYVSDGLDLAHLTGAEYGAPAVERAVGRDAGVADPRLRRFLPASL